VTISATALHHYRGLNWIVRTRLTPGTLTAHATNDGVPYVVSGETNRAVMIGHPLWHRSEDDAIEDQIIAIDDIRAQVGGGEVTPSDVFELVRNPLKMLRWLM